MHLATVHGPFVISSPSDIRMREISFLRFSQDHLPCVWPQANLSAWKTEIVWAKESLHFGNQSPGSGKQATTVASYPGSTFPFGMSQHRAHTCQLAVLESGMNKGPSHLPFP